MRITVEELQRALDHAKLRVIKTANVRANEGVSPVLALSNALMACDHPTFPEKLTIETPKGSQSWSFPTGKLRGLGGHALEEYVADAFRRFEK